MNARPAPDAPTSGAGAVAAAPSIGRLAQREGERTWLNDLFDRLFPICRSITGPGLRESLRLLSEVMPLHMHGVPSGTLVFDWKVPPEWRIRDAWLKGPDGSKVADFQRTNLAVVNYSVPVNRRMPLAELQPRLHSIRSLPHAIPYVTSYYREDWGFCLSQQARDRLPEGEYHAFIDSELVAGELNYGEAALPGEQPETILLSSYLCHPSLANNELSGPLVMALLYRRLAAWKRRRFTYRFVALPETIGSLTYLFAHGESLKAQLFAGLVLTCLGGDRETLSYKTTRRENTTLDRLIGHLNRTGAMPTEVRPFTPTSGSDERQYCSPGFNLPVGQFARMVYGEYPAYHNSLDTKELMGIEPLIDSADRIERVLRLLEVSGTFVNLSPFGEPQLGRRGLYPNTNSPESWHLSSDEVLDQRATLNAILMMLNYSDGTTSMVEIADRMGLSIEALLPIVERLETEGLLKLHVMEPGGRP